MLHEYSLPTVVFLAVLLIGWYIATRFKTETRLRKLGGKPPQVPYKYPFGFDMLWENIEVPVVRGLANFPVQ
jgi:hypothetical protein